MPLRAVRGEVDPRTAIRERVRGRTRKSLVLRRPLTPVKFTPDVIRGSPRASGARPSPRWLAALAALRGEEQITPPRPPAAAPFRPPPRWSRPCRRRPPAGGRTGPRPDP